MHILIKYKTIGIPIFHPILLPLFFMSFLFISKTTVLTVAPIKHSIPIIAKIKNTPIKIRNIIIKERITLIPPIFFLLLNIFFDYLTVQEHLEYMCEIKGTKVNRK